MMHEVAHRIPDSITARAIGLAAATSVAFLAAKYFGDRSPETKIKPEGLNTLNIDNAASGDSGFTPIHNGVEIDLMPQLDSQQNVIFDSNLILPLEEAEAKPVHHSNTQFTTPPYIAL